MVKCYWLVCVEIIRAYGSYISKAIGGQVLQRFKKSKPLIWLRLLPSALHANFYPETTNKRYD